MDDALADAVSVPDFLILKRRQTVSRTGNREAETMPRFRSSPRQSETVPTSAGPNEQPRSPARARSAKSPVPPRGRAADAILKVPGHIMPTAKPHRPQPASAGTGDFENEISA